MIEEQHPATTVAIHGCDPLAGVVGMMVDQRNDSVLLYRRVAGQIVPERRVAPRWVVLSDETVVRDPMVQMVAHVTELHGAGLRFLAEALSGKEAGFDYAIGEACRRILKLKARPRRWGADELRGHAYGLQNEEQFLLREGITFFPDMQFEDLVWLALDIETVQLDRTVSFQTTDSPTNRIITIQLKTNKGDEVFIANRAAEGHAKTAEELAADEREILIAAIERIREIDPDVVVGHNITSFDLPFIEDHCRMHGLRCALGREGRSVHRWKHDRWFKIGAASRPWPWFTIPGRQLVDLLPVAMDYSERDKELKYSSEHALTLKNLAKYFKVAPADRVYLPGGEIGRRWVSGTEAERDEVMRYALHDIAETLALRPFFLSHFFALAQMVPAPFERVVGMGTSSMLEKLVVREYLARGHALPIPGTGKEKIQGATTAILRQGVFRDVGSADFQSLYPTVMLKFGYLPKSDVLGVFGQLLALLRELRLHHKAEAKRYPKGTPEHLRHDGQQAALKVLINTAYGAMGSDHWLFNDFEAGGNVTREGRRLLKAMVLELEQRGCEVIEIDTDGAFFTVPSVLHGAPDRIAALVAEVGKTVSSEVKLEFAGYWPVMYCPAAKNYVLMDADGRMTVKGASMRSSKDSPAIAAAREQMLRALLEGNIERLRTTYLALLEDVRHGRLPVASLAQTARISQSLEEYRAGLEENENRNPQPWMEALARSRARDTVRVGDDVRYYIGPKAKASDPDHLTAQLLVEDEP